MCTVLVIEDDAEVLTLIQSTLEQQSYQTLTTPDSTLGVSLARQKLPDLILCNLMMPRLDGYGVLREVRRHQATETTPLIFLLGSFELSAIQQGVRMGVDDYLTKPLVTDELLNIVNRCLQRQNKSMSYGAIVYQQLKLLEKQAQDYREIAETNMAFLNQVSEDLRHPFSNMTIALHMAKTAKTPAERDRFLDILEEECLRGGILLNEIAEMQEFLTPQKLNVLRQLKSLRQPDDPGWRR
jgi:two-component system, OmpR family, alkaline phosphatase synthesis response regulator PhoP